MKLYTLAQAARRTGIAMSAWSQAVQYGRVKTVLKINEARHDSKRIPIHHVSEEEVEKFMAFMKAGGHVSTMDIKATRRTPEVTKDDIAEHAVRRALEMRAEARELGMTLEEYRGAV